MSKTLRQSYTQIAVFLTLASILSFLLIYYTKQDAQERSGLSMSSEYIKSIGGKETPDFNFLNQYGTPITKDDILGAWNFVFFGFSQCEFVCPTTLAKLRDFQIQLLETSVKTKTNVIFVSLDPQTDKPAILREYLSNFGDNFIGLTGDQGSLSTISEFFSAKGPKIEEHASAIFLIDPNGIYHGHFTKALPTNIMVTLFEQISGDRF